MDELSANRLREVLHYDPRSGDFTWIAHAHRVDLIGRIAGRLHRVRGYREIHVDGRLYYAHRLAWLYMTSEWPTTLVDHRDTDRGNNRWENLRAADHSLNGLNRRGATKRSRTGVLGVAPNGAGFRARVKVGPRDLNLGTFQTIAAANAAASAIRQEIMGN